MMEEGIGAWISVESLRWPLTIAYLGLICLISLYGLHRYWLVYLFRKNLKNRKRPMSRYEDLPKVTVQLPMFNEFAVVERIIDAACEIDYPKSKLQIQVLDDSTDDSKLIAEARCQYWQERGIDIQYIHRTDRTGYKAGALSAAMPQCTGELVAIFDADFVPPKNFLKRTVNFFTDPELGMVQTKWGHINRDDSLLTKGQAIFLDGHFIIEHTARNRSGAWINFNGTAGIWRKQAIADGGGWQHDTLTEDVDLSYRTQLAGWKFLFLPWLTCPAELPPEINSFKSQQHRWTKGSIQTALKLLPRVLKAPVSWKIKTEAFFHLTSPMVYLYITLLAILFYPAIYVNLNAFEDQRILGILVGMSFFALGTISGTVFYIVSQKVQRRSAWSTLIQVPILMAIGIGIALNNAIACLEALVGYETPFIRTPKYNVPGLNSDTPPSEKPSKQKLGVIPIPTLKRSICLLEIGLGVYMLECIRMSLIYDSTVVSLPFLALFASGYLYVGLSSLWVHVQAWKDARRPLPAAAT
ncbi:cellulose synthase family protein [Poriferisphaera sp. WC338]|uniref:cellulose synthase family protein n=1 Tax=Poriferisphaera sp. WC338 TaxID=3425129 RepID=UPI003D819DE0